LRESVDPLVVSNRCDMAIYGQPNRWQCGPFALKHALLALGRFAHEDELAWLAGSSELSGTDEKGLTRAARVHGCDLGLIRLKHPEAARKALADTLGIGVPVLLCIDQWEHWVAAVNVQGDRFVVFDSHFEQPLRIESWPALRDRLVYNEQRRFRRRTLYDIHPLAPRRPQRLRFWLTPRRAEQLKETGHGVLERDWDELARRVLALGVPAGQQLELGTPLAEWIATHRDAIVEEAAQYSVLPDLAELGRTLDEIGFVATLYGVFLRPDEEAHAARRLVVMAVARATRVAERQSWAARTAVSSARDTLPPPSAAEPVPPPSVAEPVPPPRVAEGVEVG